MGSRGVDPNQVAPRLQGELGYMQETDQISNILKIMIPNFSLEVINRKGEARMNSAV